MLTINKILVPTDFSACSEKALQKAMKLAKFYFAELHIIHVTVLPTPDPYTFTFPDMFDLKDVVLKKIKDQLNEMKDHIEGINVKISEDSGYTVSPFVERYVEENKIDLVVIGTHGHTGFERKLLGSTSEEILRFVKCPVMTVHHESSPLDTIKRICVPVDYSEESKKSIKIAVEFAKHWNAELEILHVVLNVNKIPYLMPPSRLEDDIVERSETALEKFIEDLIPKEIQYEISVKVRSSTVYISEFCESNKSDMIIISTHGLSGIKKFLLGSTTEKILRSTRLPMLVLK